MLTKEKYFLTNYCQVYHTFMSNGGYEKYIMNCSLWIVAFLSKQSSKLHNCYFRNTPSFLPATTRSYDQQVFYEANGNSIISFQKGNFILANCNGFMEAPRAVPHAHDWKFFSFHSKDYIFLPNSLFTIAYSKNNLKTWLQHYSLTSLHFQHIFWIWSIHPIQSVATKYQERLYLCILIEYKSVHSCSYPNSFHQNWSVSIKIYETTESLKPQY